MKLRKKSIVFLRHFFRKRKQSLPLKQAHLFARKLPIELAHRRCGLDWKFLWKFCAKMALMVGMAWVAKWVRNSKKPLSRPKRPGWPRLAKWLKWPKLPKWPNWREWPKDQKIQNGQKLPKNVEKNKEAKKRSKPKYTKTAKKSKTVNESKKAKNAKLPNLVKEPEMQDCQDCQDCWYLRLPKLPIISTKFEEIGETAKVSETDLVIIFESLKNWAFFGEIVELFIKQFAFFKIAEGGKFAIECVPTGFVSQNRLPAYLWGMFGKKIRKFWTWEKLETMIRNDGFFWEKNVFIFYHPSLQKREGSKSAHGGQPSCCIYPWYSC